MRLYIKLIDKINKCLLILIGMLLGLMFLFIFSQIIARFVFSASLVWSEELARYLMIYSVFIGGSLAIRNNRMISVEFIMQKLPINIKNKMKVSVLVLSILFFLIMLIKGIELLKHVYNQSAPSLKISMSIPYSSVAIGAAFLILNTLAIIFEIILKKRVS